LSPFLYLKYFLRDLELRNTIMWDKHNLMNKVDIFGWQSNFIMLGTRMEFILDFWRPE